MGRRKIDIVPIGDDKTRRVTFLRRKLGLFKKAQELSVLCKCHVAVTLRAKPGSTFIAGDTANEHADFLSSTTLSANGIRHVSRYTDFWGTCEPRSVARWLAPDDFSLTQAPQPALAQVAGESVLRELRRSMSMMSVHEGRNGTREDGDDAEDEVECRKDVFLGWGRSRSWDNLCSAILLHPQADTCSPVHMDSQREGAEIADLLLSLHP